MSASYDAIGRLHQKWPTQKVSDKFRKREFVIEIEDGQYPQHIKFQLTQEGCDRLDSYEVGRMIRVSFNLRGKPFQGKDGTTMYFTNLQAWRIEAMEHAQGSLGTVEHPTAAQPSYDNTSFDDVPF